MRKIKEMQAIVEAYHQSKTGPKQFATNQGLSLAKLKYWIKKLKNKELNASSFIQIEPSPITETEADPYVEVHYPNGVKIKTLKTELGFLSQLISVCLHWDLAIPTSSIARHVICVKVSMG